MTPPDGEISITAFALAEDNTPHLFFTRSQMVEWGQPPIMEILLWHAERQGGLWRETFLQKELNWYPSVRAAVDSRNRVHMILGGSYFGYNYRLRDEDGIWSNDSPVIEGWGDVDLVLSSDDEPRLIWDDGTSLVLSTRVIRWLDQSSFVPFITHFP